MLVHTSITILYTLMGILFVKNHRSTSIGSHSVTFLLVSSTGNIVVGKRLLDSCCEDETTAELGSCARRHLPLIPLLSFSAKDNFFYNSVSSAGSLCTYTSSGPFGLGLFAWNLILQTRVLLSTL